MVICETMIFKKFSVQSVSTRHPRPHAGSLMARIAAIALTALVFGCASNGRDEPSPELVSSGWSGAPTLAPVADFDTYVLDITQELRVHRVPFDRSKADAELSVVAPLRIRPDTGCRAESPRGIAVLIHGLSDTAFAMRDLAQSLSKQCFEARVLLLPGHGTRPADLLVVDHKDWLAHVQAAVVRARRESDFVVLAGFSLGAALALTVAAESPDHVDAVIGVSPAYRLRSNTLARQARWVATIRPWLDLGGRDDFARYGALPTRGIASTMAVISLMDARMRSNGTFGTPWFFVQSEDDEVIDVAANRRFFDANAGHPRSRVVNYFSRQPKAMSGDREVWLPAADTTMRVVGLSHLALHISPQNAHYGLSGSYRNCGRPPLRREDEVEACRQARYVWYGVGGQSPPAGEAGARATFNPHYPDLERRIGEFLNGIDGRDRTDVAFQQSGP